MFWKRWMVVAAALVVTAGALGWAASRSATVSLAGASHEVAIPAPHLCLDRAPGRAVYLVLGDYDLSRFLSERAAAQGWRYAEQLGSGHRLTKGSLLLSVARRQRGASFVVELTLSLSRVPGASAP